MRGVNWCLGWMLTWAIAPVSAQETLFYQCVDANGERTIQNEPCPSGSSQETRSVQGVRSFPADAPSRSTSSSQASSTPALDATRTPASAPASAPAAQASPEAPRASRRPQPAISDGPAQSTTFYQCTDADGNVQIQSQTCPPGSRQETRMLQGVRSFSTAPAAAATLPGSAVATPSHGGPDSGALPVAAETGKSDASASPVSVAPVGPAISDGPVENITFYHCTDTSGAVMVQNQPCPRGSRQEKRVMQGVRSFTIAPSGTGTVSPASAMTVAPPPGHPVAATVPSTVAPIVPVAAALPATSALSGLDVLEAPVEDITFYHCTDTSGAVMVQNQPCPRGSRQEKRVMEGVRSFTSAPSGTGTAPPASAMTAASPPGHADAGAVSTTIGPSEAAAALPAMSVPVGAGVPDDPAETITFYRCTDTEGAVMLQNQSCPRGMRQEKRVMQRARPISTATAEPVAGALSSPEEPQTGPVLDTEQIAAEAKAKAEADPAADLPPPPALSRCATPDGNLYFSESGMAGERCVPLRTVGLDGNPLRGAGEACEIVRDECTVLSDEALCDGWRQYLGEAESSWRFAHPDNVESRQSEFQRLGRIVSESRCAAIP